MKNKKQQNSEYKNYVEAGLEEVTRDMLEVSKDNVEVNVYVKKNTTKLENSVFVLQKFAKDVMNRNYSTSTYRVLFYFISLTEYENYLSIDINTISEDVQINKRSVLRALKELEDDKIVIKLPHPMDKRRHDYFLNPMAMWRGKEINRKKKIEKLKKNKHQLNLFSEHSVHSLLPISQKTHTTL